MKNPMRVLILENRASKQFIAQQLLNNYDMEFTWQRVACESELRDIVQHISPTLVYRADDLPLDSREDALELLYLLSPKTAVIHVVQTEEKSGTTARAPSINGIAAGEQEEPWRNGPPSLLDGGGNAVVMTDSAGWISYANICASRLLRDSHEDSIGTLLGRDHDFTSPLCGAQRLAIFAARSGVPRPIHLNDLVERAGAPARGTLGAFPIDALALGGSGSVKLLGDRPSSKDALRSITSQFIGESHSRGMIARVGKDAVLVIIPDPAQTPALALHESAQASVASIAPVFLTEIVEPVASHRPPLEARLDDALQRDAIGVHYQPQFELQSGRGCGVEALARWALSSGESIAPIVFIPVAERAGMIHSLGASVLKNACMTAAAWRGREEAGLTVSVNLSTLQINRDFIRILSEILDKSGLRAARLELEIAESAVLSNADLTATCLKEWKRLGVRVAVNHAGQNYSSLSYLSRLSINRLKLDKSLIQGLTPAKKSISIVHALISLGAQLGVEVLAEGVETPAQFELLTELGCQQVQGFLLARPAPAVQAQLALRRPWGSLPKTVRRPTSEVTQRYAS
ncbi:MAG TPA: EAL domain-containing protein [Steroidobacteraceae bacterium]|nr:EAL domain-containing protein [Steroidobacteraceae bacterium]